MGTLFFLIFFPILAAIGLLLFKNDSARNAITIISAIVIAVGSIVLAVMYFSSAEAFAIPHGLEAILDYGMIVIEVCLGLFLFVLGIKYKKYAVCLLVLIQLPLMVWFELKVGHNIEVGTAMFIDKLSIIMALIIGIIGSLICVYALGYMKEFAHHHPEQKDRRPLFFFLMFIFLSAMFGIVFSNSLLWLYFFWEVTTICSFLLIGYTKTPEATRNSFRALIMNLSGGVAFAFAIVIFGTFYGTLELDTLLSYGVSGYGDLGIILVVGLIAFAGLTKAAQMPFSSWLLGAMVAPTPTSALLHSSTMVKAGVYIILRLAPVLGFTGPGATMFGSINPAGLMTVLVGGLTFLFASFIAISQSNAKKILAYSTVANLGLIVVCGGIGTAEAVWAGVMLVIFHAVAKSLLFLCVGTAEHNIGSRDVESFDGLFNRMPKLAIAMCVGICGMFVAPFGMLISKWAAMKAIVDTGNIILVVCLVFGSAATLFFWTKWLGKITAIASGEESIESGVDKNEKLVINSLAGLTLIVCLIFPIISKFAVLPYVTSAFDLTYAAPTISEGNMYIMVAMVAVIILLTLVGFGRTRKRIVPIYMGGANAGDNVHFQGSLGKTLEAGYRNWYMEGYFGERKMNIAAIVTSTVAIVACLSMLLPILISGFIFIFGGVM